MIARGHRNSATRAGHGPPSILESVAALAKMNNGHRSGVRADRFGTLRPNTDDGTATAKRQPREPRRLSVAADRERLVGFFGSPRPAPIECAGFAVTFGAYCLETCLFHAALKRRLPCVKLECPGGGELALVHKANQTSENGQPLAVPWEFFDGEVTASAPDPWEVTWHYTEGLTLNRLGEESVQFVRDPLPVATGCAPGPGSCKRRCADPKHPVRPRPRDDRSGGRERRRDLGAANRRHRRAGSERLRGGPLNAGPDLGRLPQRERRPAGLNLDAGSRVRFVLLDPPEGQKSRILAIAIVAPEARFVDVVEAATSIVQSVEFHPNGAGSSPTPKRRALDDL